MNEGSIKDQFQRPLHDLRISVIDRCNFRCTYCMPVNKDHPFMHQEEWLSFAEMKRFVQIFVALGVDKVRITGGEPLLRPNLAQLVSEFAQIKGIKDLALTTNGSLLGKYARDLKEAGLDRITVSLDTLDPDTFFVLNGTKTNIQDVVEGIFQAQRVGFKDIKINAVIQKNVNEQDILPLVNLFRNTGIILRFIEYMDVGQSNQWQSAQVLSSAETLQRIEKYFPLKSLTPNYMGEVATRYIFEDGGGEIGFISSISQPFCRDCSRARLSADGKMYTCLFSEKGFDLKSKLSLSDKAFSEEIISLWQKRDDRYSEMRQDKGKTQEPVEMYRLGG